MSNKERCREVANTKPYGTGIPVRLMDPEVYWGNPGNSEGSSFQPNNGKDEGKETERMGKPCDCRSLFLETRRVGLGLVRALCVKMEIGGCSAVPLYHCGNGYSRRVRSYSDPSRMLAPCRRLLRLWPLLLSCSLLFVLFLQWSGRDENTTQDSDREDWVSVRPHEQRCGDTKLHSAGYKENNDPNVCLCGSV
uniref:Transmembrane protein n=1 Tax=Timema shepardi TaxID=629360 RepID=A0A7R9FXW8_TIMSH|nr:unnamed protein product [Timema shepardi]